MHQLKMVTALAMLLLAAIAVLVPQQARAQSQMRASTPEARNVLALMKTYGTTDPQKLLERMGQRWGKKSGSGSAGGSKQPSSTGKQAGGPKPPPAQPSPKGKGK